MHHSVMEGPFVGNLIVIAAAGSVTIGCFVAMFWMLLRPGEQNRAHEKYQILRKDR